MEYLPRLADAELTAEWDEETAMYRGNLVEIGDREQITTEPQHPHEQGGLQPASPVADPQQQQLQRRDQWLDLRQ